MSPPPLRFFQGFRRGLAREREREHERSARQRWARAERCSALPARSRRANGLRYDHVLTGMNSCGR